MRYETKQDLINEEEVIKHFTKGEHPYEKLGENDLDFVVFSKDGKQKICYVEVKCTNTHSEEYKTQIISVKKLKKMQDYRHKLPTYLVYRYSDCTKSIELKNVEGVLKWGGRTVVRAGAVNDKELVVYIKKTKMKTI